MIVEPKGHQQEMPPARLGALGCPFLRSQSLQTILHAPGEREEAGEDGHSARDLIRLRSKRLPIHITNLLP